MTLNLPKPRKVESPTGFNLYSVRLPNTEQTITAHYSHSGDLIRATYDRTGHKVRGASNLFHLRALGQGQAKL